MIFAYIAYDSYQRSYNEEVEHCIEFSRIAGQNFENFVSGILRNEATIGYVLTTSSFLTNRLVDAILEESKIAYKSIKDFAWVNPRGVIVSASNLDAVGLDVSQDLGVKQVLNGNDWGISDLRTGVISGKKIFTISKAIRRGNRGELEGIVFAIIDVANLDREFSFNLPEGRAVTVLDRSGKLIFRHPKISPVTMKKKGSESFPDILAALKGQERAGILLSPFDGKQRIYGAIPLSFGWVTIASVEEEDATAPIKKITYGQAFLFLMVLGGGLLLSLVLSRKFSKSIGRLQSLADLVGKDELIAEGHFSILEFQQLADGFKIMAGKVRSRQEELKILNENLEQKVMERTLALEVSNLQLKSANEELNNRTNKLRRLVSELTTVEQRARKELASILHDNLQQVLVATKLKAEILSGFGNQVSNEVIELLREAIEITRTLTAQLTPLILFQAGLPEGLKWLSKWMDKNQTFKVNLEIQNHLPKIEEDLKIFLFECVRELLFNSRKHSGVASATVILRQIDGNLNVIVADEGRGFNPQGLRTSPDINSIGFGLFSIMERIPLFGGSIEIESEPGKGARFSITVKLEDSLSNTRLNKELPHEYL